MTKTPLDSRAEHGDTVDIGHVTRVTTASVLSLTRDTRDICKVLS